MKPATIHHTPVGQIHGVEATSEQLGRWMATPEGVRDVVLKGYVVAAHFLDDMVPREIFKRVAPSQGEVEFYADRADAAIRAGRLIDFGRWTNDVIKHGGNRGGPMYTKGVIGHPFRDDWMFMHRWDEGDRDMVAVYLITPLEPDKPAGDCEAVELAPMNFGGDKLLAIGDRLILEPARNEGVIDYRKYHCACIPAIWNYLPGAEDYSNGKTPESGAAGNVLDPLMTALLILSTRGIDRVTVAASEKLQKARRKSGKPPIPSYDKVHSTPYITAITAKLSKRPKGSGLGGTHASPIPHLRMGHSRTYPNGKTSLVRDALVNFSDEARLAWLKGNRSHYTVKSPTEVPD